MKISSIQEIYEEKFKRQKAIKALRRDASGHCAHIGKISPGCLGCFVPEEFEIPISCGNRCSLDCPYCFTVRNQDVISPQKRHAIKERAFVASFASTFYQPRVAFTGGGDPLQHLDIIEEFMTFFKEIEGQMKRKPWYYLYTNGVLASKEVLRQLHDWGLNEIRFHLGASNFSDHVYRYMGAAVPLFEAVTVETPSWPLHRKKLFEMLPRLEEVGVKHLNIGEIEIRPQNIKKIGELLPNAKIYQSYEMHLYDGGLVYDLMEDVIERGFSYSVLDCNSFVKSIQRTGGKWICHAQPENMCAAYSSQLKKKKQVTRIRA